MFRSTRDRLRRQRRRFLLGSGPLKRTSDRLQMAGRLLVVVAVLAALPVAFVAAGMARTRLEAVAAAQAADRHVVGATVLHDTVKTITGSDGDSTSFHIVRAEVRWRTSHGTRQASLVVPAGTTGGSTVPVWVDGGGQLTTAPMDRTSIGDSELVVGVAVTAGLPLTVVGLHYALCFVLDVRRRRRWGQDWARVEREWRARLG